jgi:hypothetical protein
MKNTRVGSPRVFKKLFHPVFSDDVKDILTMRINGIEGVDERIERIWILSGLPVLSVQRARMTKQVNPTFIEVLERYDHDTVQRDLNDIPATGEWLHRLYEDSTLNLRDLQIQINNRIRSPVPPSSVPASSVPASSVPASSVLNSRVPSSTSPNLNSNEDDVSDSEFERSLADGLDQSQNYDF